MERLDVTYVDSISEKDLSIILDCEIVDSNGNSTPLNDVSVVISVFDSTDNFITQKIVDGEAFQYNFNSEDDLLEYIYNNILDIDGNTNLNAGIYQLRFSFILDTFDSVNNDDNRFIVTEISPDGTEIRLNPLSNDEKFIDVFSKIKNHERTDKFIRLTETGFAKFYREYVNSVFTEETISNIVSDVEIRDKTLFDYIREVTYNRLSDVDEQSERDEGASELAGSKIDDIRVGLISKKGDALIFISKYFESIKRELFKKIKNTSPENDNKLKSILNNFKIDIKNKLQEFVNDSINEVVDTVLKN